MSVDISKIKIGDKVHYIPFKGCDESRFENGIVKTIPNNGEPFIFVVYNCGEDWDHFKDYTAERTNISHLELGWFN